MATSIVLLAYKEAENLNILLPKIKMEIEKCETDYEIVVIDSTEPLDNTAEVCEKWGARYINQEEPSFGGAFRTGIKYANKEKFLIMDADGSHPTDRIPAIYHKFVEENCDVVIGSRYVEGGVTNDVFTSQVMSHILNFCYRIVLGIDAKDISTDYRMYRTADLKKVKLECWNFDVVEEVLLKLKLNKSECDLKAREVPIIFQKRMFGESKRQLVKFIISFIKTLFMLMGMRLKRVL
jgi:dolichol-phosphate mannosyltransferase